MSADLPRFPVDWDVFNRFEAFKDALIGAERGCRVSFEPTEFIWLSLSFRLRVGREWLAILSSDRSPGDCIDLYSAFKYMKALREVVGYYLGPPFWKVQMNARQSLKASRLPGSQLPQVYPQSSWKLCLVGVGQCDANITGWRQVVGDNALIAENGNI
jgi:hypothetical protein